MEPFRVGRGTFACEVAGTGAVEVDGNEGVATGRKSRSRCRFSCSATRLLCAAIKPSSINSTVDAARKVGENGGDSGTASEQTWASKSEKPDLQLVVRALSRQ